MRLYDFTALWVQRDGTEQLERFRAKGREEAERYVEQRMYRDAEERAAMGPAAPNGMLWCKDLRLASEPPGGGYCVPHVVGRRSDGFEDEWS